MREIKFRAWFEVEKKMVESENLGFQYEGDEENPFTFAFDKTDIDESGNEKGTLCFALMQYTGLKDKNGREIYEGDIVECFRESNSVVCMKMNAWGLDTNGIGFKPFYEIYGHCEIIGNIYEHHELLEDK